MYVLNKHKTVELLLNNSLLRQTNSDIRMNATSLEYYLGYSVPSLYPMSSVLRCTLIT